MRQRHHYLLLLRPPICAYQVSMQIEKLEAQRDTITNSISRIRGTQSWLYYRKKQRLRTLDIWAVSGSLYRSRSTGVACLSVYRGIMSCHGVTSSCLGNSICQSTASDIYVYKWEYSYSFIKSFLLPLIFPCAQFILLRHCFFFVIPGTELTQETLWGIGRKRSAHVTRILVLSNNVA